MPALVAGIHVLAGIHVSISVGTKDVDGRNKSGHDDEGVGSTSTRYALAAICARCCHGPFDNSLQFRNAGAAIRAGAKRPPDFGDIHGCALGDRSADGFKPDAETGADDRPGLGHAFRTAA